MSSTRWEARLSGVCRLYPGLKLVLDAVRSCSARHRCDSKTARSRGRYRQRSARRYFEYRRNIGTSEGLPGGHSYEDSARTESTNRQAVSQGESRLTEQKPGIAKRARVSARGASQPTCAGLLKSSHAPCIGHYTGGGSPPVMVDLCCRTFGLHAPGKRSCPAWKSVISVPRLPPAEPRMISDFPARDRSSVEPRLSSPRV